MRSIFWFQTIDRSIERYLQEQHASQAALAEQLGMESRMLSLRRRGKREWKLSEVCRLQQILGISVVFDAVGEWMEGSGSNAEDNNDIRACL